MNLRVLFHEHLQNTISIQESWGLVILQSEPQVRTITRLNHKDFLQEPVTLAFPHLIFTIRYFMLGGKYVYPGFGSYGLHVHCRKGLLKKFDDDVCYLPTDYYRRGMVCTDHSFDYSQYNSLQDLVKAVVGLWWNTVHTLEYCPGDVLWEEILAKDLEKAQWISAGPYENTAQINSWSVGKKLKRRPTLVSSLGKKK